MIMLTLTVDEIVSRGYHEMTTSLGNLTHLAMQLLQLILQYCRGIYLQGITLVEKMASGLVSSIIAIYDSYNDQLHQTPLTVKACLVSALIIIIISVSILMKKNTKKQPQPVEDDPRVTDILNVVDLAKTAYEPGHVDTLIDLIRQRHFDINYPLPKSGLTLFLCACLSGQRRLIRFLLDKGAQVSQATYDGDSALYLATFGVLGLQAIGDVTGVLTDLITAGCDVNRQNKRGFTALHRAASKGNLNVIKCLLKHGADPYLTTATGIYPIDLATNASHLDAAELLYIELDNPYVWDVVEPHTPARVRLGLMSPARKHLIESTVPRPSNITHYVQNK